MNQQSVARFRAKPRYPLVEVVQTRHGPVTTVRAFYLDVMNAEGRKAFDKFDQAWRKMFPLMSNMEFNEDSAEIWIYVPHPGPKHLYGVSRRSWDSFCRKWSLFLAPDLPTHLRP